MNQLARYLEDTGRTPDEVAVDLTALLGKAISPGAVRLWSTRTKPPKAWAAALNLAPEDEPLTAALDADGEPALILGEPLAREDGLPPTAPEGTKITRPATGRMPLATAKQRLEMAYGAIGSGMSLITENDGYEKVAEGYAPGLADAWMAAAESNERVAKIVRFMESGGPVGELVVSHIILVLGFVYVSGRGPDLAFLYGSRFGGYRTAAIARSIAAEAEAHLNGSASAPAESGMGAATG